ncbi:hypothetical protein DASC09_033420 [Saccharomycopsis crataegensis]|uniref:Uncharacterized protein n=1 Tax=Saccharomycopsis crataegensis TaxID=43959 RepID=A0AAV5QN46_9ASCO|nr:hypothetical protein DASC09_033420 [Saccharomycopsis crataegensis]
MVKWNWGRKKTDNSKKGKQKQGATIEDTLENNTSLIDLLNDWRNETSSPYNTTNILNNNGQNDLYKEKELLFQRNKNAGADLYSCDDDLNGITNTFQHSSQNDEGSASGIIQEDLDTVIDTNTHLDTAQTIIARPLSEMPSASNLKVSQKPPHILTTKETSVYSENTKKYHQIIDCLDEYEDQLNVMMQEFQNRPNIKDSNNYNSNNNSDGESIISSSTTDDNSLFTTPRRNNIATPTSDVYDMTESSYSAVSLNENNCKKQGEFQYKLPNTIEPSKIHPQQSKQIKQSNRMLLPLLNDEPENSKAVLIKELAIPRTERGSLLDDSELELNEHNDYNSLIAKQYFSTRKQLIAIGNSSKKGTKHITFKKPIEMVPQSSNIFSPTKNLFPRDKSELIEYPRKADENQSKKIKEIGKNSSLNQDFGGDRIKKQSYFKSEFDKPKTTANPFYKRSNESLLRSNNPANSFKKISSPDFGDHASVAYSTSSDRSSIKSNISSFDSPDFKISKQQHEKQDLPAYIFNHNPKASKNAGGKERMKLNRASSVYMNEPVADFKNIDLSDNPLPQIGNLLSGNLSVDFNISSNPYDDSSFSNPYRSFTSNTSNPYLKNSSNAYSSSNSNPYL